MTLFSGCVSPYYVPNVRNVNIFKGKGDIHISASGQLYPDGKAANAQIGVAVTDHIALNAAYAYTYNEFRSEPLRGHFAEVGLGYYAHFSDLYFDVFGGYGRGEGKCAESLFQFFSSVEDRRTSATYERWYVQPSFGFKSDFVTGVLTLRCTALDADEQVSVITVTDSTFDFRRRPTYFYLEPSTTLLFFNGRCKVFTQTGLNISVNDSQTNLETFGFVALGVQYNFSLRRKKASAGG